MSTKDEFDPPPMDPAIADRVRFVMVQPTHPGNIGAAARAMKNMGLRRLVLVDPLRFPDEEARFRAASAVDLVDDAEVVGTLGEAIDDCQLVVGTSARNRRVPWPMIGPREVGERLLAEVPHGPVAVLFGREASGLTNDELARCQLHLFVPSDPAYPSLNISMAMQLVAWELRSAWLEAGTRLPEPPWDRPWADAGAVEGLIEHLATTLERTGFTDRRDAGQVLLRLRRLFYRTRLDQVEVNILRGFCTSVERVADRTGATAPGEDATPDEPHS